MFCPECGKENDENAKMCSYCGSAMTPDGVGAPDAAAMQNTAAVPPPMPMMPAGMPIPPMPPVDNGETVKALKQLRTTFILCTLVVALLFVLSPIVTRFLPKEVKQTQYEYKKLTFYNDGYDREGSEAGKYTSIDFSEEELNELGAEGWEVVGCYLEMETAYPNFGDSSYVTGIQPNIRPQCVVVILKRLL